MLQKFKDVPSGCIETCLRSYIYDATAVDEIYRLYSLTSECVDGMKLYILVSCEGLLVSELFCTKLPECLNDSRYIDYYVDAVKILLKQRLLSGDDDKILGRLTDLTAEQLRCVGCGFTPETVKLLNDYQAKALSYLSYTTNQIEHDADSNTDVSYARQ